MHAPLPSSARRRRAVLAGLAAGLALAAIDGRAVELSSLETRSGSIVDATVIVTPAMAIFQQSLDETGLRGAGCRHRTSDPAAIGALTKLLRDAHLTERVVYQRPDAREAVYLTADDGFRWTLVFGDNRGGSLPVEGTVETSAGGDLRTGAVVADAGLAADLRRWTAAYGGAGVGNGCARPVEARPVP